MICDIGRDVVRMVRWAAGSYCGGDDAERKEPAAAVGKINGC